VATRLPLSLIIILAVAALVSSFFAVYAENEHLDFLQNHPIVTNLISGIVGFSFASLTVAIVFNSFVSRSRLKTGRAAIGYALGRFVRQTHQLVTFFPKQLLANPSEAPPTIDHAPAAMFRWLRDHIARTELAQLDPILSSHLAEFYKACWEWIDNDLQLLMTTLELNAVDQLWGPIARVEEAFRPGPAGTIATPRNWVDLTDDVYSLQLLVTAVVEQPRTLRFIEAEKRRFRRSYEFKPSRYQSEPYLAIPDPLVDDPRLAHPMAPIPRTTMAAQGIGRRRLRISNEQKRLRSRAADIGPCCLKVIERMTGTSLVHPSRAARGVRIARSVLALAAGHANEELEKACAHALAIGVLSPGKARAVIGEYLRQTDGFRRAASRVVP
jgi:hypothetical protein